MQAVGLYATTGSLTLFCRLSCQFLSRLEERRVTAARLPRLLLIIDRMIQDAELHV